MSAVSLICSLHTAVDSQCFGKFVRWNGTLNLSRKDVLTRHFAGIERFVGVFVGSQGPALQGQSAKNTSRSRPRENISLHGGIRLRRSIPSDRSGSYGGLTAKRKFTLKETLHTLRTHHQHDHVGFGTAR